MRPVFNGHYVPVRPSGLTNPRLVLYSRDVAFQLLGFTEEQIEAGPDFTNYVSGNLHLSDVSWACDALHAFHNGNTLYQQNCPYDTSSDYGDGGAISIGEIQQHQHNIKKMPLVVRVTNFSSKGAGTTPFHRGADGRAALRSSIREFLASKAML